MMIYHGLLIGQHTDDLERLPYTNSFLGERARCAL